MEATTHRLVLRDVSTGDLEPMIVLWMDEGTKHGMGDWGPQAIEEVLPWIEGAINANQATPRRAHIAVIIERVSGEVVGFIGFGPPSDGKEHWGDVDFGYAVKPEFCGRGYGTEALRAVIDFCFDELGISSFFGETAQDNAVSTPAMQSAGMKHVGVAPDGQAVYRIERDARSKTQVADASV